MKHIAKFGHQVLLSQIYMLVHWVKVFWAKDGGSGTPWDPTIIFSEKKSTSLNATRLHPMSSKLYWLYWSDIE